MMAPLEFTFEAAKKNCGLSLTTVKVMGEEVTVL